MSQAQAEATFPGSGGSGIPPSPSRENPGQVFPQSSPDPPAGTVLGGRAQRGSPSYIGNPYLLHGAFQKLDHALCEVIQILESEEGAVGGSGDEAALLNRLASWQNELDGIRAGHPVPARKESRERAEQEGGMFTE